MNRTPHRPPSAALLAVVSFAITAALLAGPALAHRGAPLVASRVR